jgi:hypothetical protein
VSVAQRSFHQSGLLRELRTTLTGRSFRFVQLPLTLADLGSSPAKILQ